MEYLLDKVIKQAEEIAFNVLHSGHRSIGFYPIPEIECYVEAILEEDCVVYRWTFIDANDNDRHYPVDRDFVRDQLEQFNNGTLY